MPQVFARESANKVPANALWLTNGIVSLFVISTYWSTDAFNFMLDMASVTSLLPYLLVAGYGVVLANSGMTYEGDEATRNRDRTIAWIAVVYTLFMFAAAGLKYVILVAVLYAPGTILYYIARREQGAELFTARERTIFLIVTAAALVGVAGLLTGRITP
jgi:arginine:ornithine antiporter/lysine permease